MHLPKRLSSFRSLALLAGTLACLHAPAALALQLERHGSLPWASPDGKRIAFASMGEGADKTAMPQIYTMAADGSDLRRLTQPPKGSFDPIWSADGSWIVFRTSGSDYSDPAELDAIHPDGTGQHVVITRKEIGWPRLSPDGKQVAFQSRDDKGAQVIMIVGLDGTGLRTLPTGLDRPWDPVWSPDGKHVVFAQQPPEAGDPVAGTESIYISDLSGKDRRLLATFQGFIQLPAWSPDGKSIAYQTYTGKRGDADIVLLDVATGKFRTLTRRDHPYLDETPAWMPDGRILFQSTRDGRYEIYVMQADGSGQQRLTR